MPAIRHSIVIQAPAQKILELVSSAAGLRRWWSADVSENEVVGTVDLGFFNRSTIYALQALGKTTARMEWRCVTGNEWKNTRLIFETAAAKDATLLRFTHADWKEETDYFIACTTTWGGLMFRLKAEAEGKGTGPLFTAEAMAY